MASGLSRSDNSQALYAFNRDGTAPEAFWHPGIGMWQLDDFSDQFRATCTGKFVANTSAQYVAFRIAEQACMGPSLSLQRVFTYWNACAKAGRPCDRIYNQIYNNGRGPLSTLDGNPKTESLGGSKRHTCLVTGPDNLQLKVVCIRFDRAYIKAQEANDGWLGAGFGPSPVSKPFYVFNQVFDRSGPNVVYDWRAWLGQDTGYRRYRTISVRRNFNGGQSRNFTKNSWRTTVRVCDLTARTGWIYLPPGLPRPPNPVCAIG